MKRAHIAKLGCILLIPLTASVYSLKSSPNTDDKLGAHPTHTNDVIKRYSEWFSRDFSSEQHLLTAIRHSLVNKTRIDKLPHELNINFNPSCSYIAVTLFQEGNKPIRWISKRETLLRTINRITRKLREKEQFADFDISNPDACRIMLEMVTDEQPLDIEKLTTSQVSSNRYEPGITGFKLRYNDRDYLYMPTDAAVNSHLLAKHALNLISKKIGVSKKTNKISERIQLMKELPITWSTINSVALITYGKDIIPLYRGYPMPVEFSQRTIFEMSQESVDWVYNNMNEDGKFLYYYDGVKDSIIDHVHPRRTEENNYYNILRHGGGIITLLRMHELTKDDKYTEAAEKALDFLTKQLRQHTYKNKEAYYVYFNKKAKLGGSGIALVAFIRYYQATGDTKYNRYIFGLAQHLLSRVAQDGEMIGYYIHPAFNNGKPILSPTADEKRQLFSFYYPGEALLGLALFVREMDLTPEYRHKAKDAARRALDFLINVRPVKYADMFKSLPSDGWLMQAIEEWSYDEHFQKRQDLDFVFNDAKQMISHMYTEQDSLYYDYPGTFYYNYGDHAYPDGARAEGLIAAYYLAKRMNEDELAEHILKNCKTVAESLMHTYNSKESTFMHKFPNKSIGSFRFKFTRQWVRVDTAQHTACFFMRLCSAMELEKRPATQKNAGDKVSPSPAVKSDYHN